MKGIKNIILWGNLSLLVLIIMMNIFSGGIWEITQQTGINKNGENNSSQITQITHTPITIDGNDGFASQATADGWPGNGSISNPYCINNYSISTAGEPGINISNTDVYFTITNVTVTGAINPQIGAFHFSNVTHGELTNNTITNSKFGFWLDLSNNNTLTENTVMNSESGFCLNYSCHNTLNGNIATNNSVSGFIQAYSSNYNTLNGNIATNNSHSGFLLFSSSNYNTLNGNVAMNNSGYGFYLYLSSNYNVLTGNTATNNNHVGIHLEFSSNNTLQDNLLYNNSIFIYGDTFNHYLQTSVTNNTINDLPILFLANAQYKTFSSAQYGQIILINCTAVNITNQNFAGSLEIAYCSFIYIQNNTVSQELIGFYLYETNNSTITNNTAKNSIYHGFYLGFSSNNTLTENIAMNNSNFGFCLTYSSIFNTLKYNNITYNSQYGLHISSTSSNNTICLNTFIGNNNGNTQANSDSQNYWNNGTHGNYWSDYTGIDSNGDGIGDISYFIDGSGAESDPYPLMSPVEYVIPEFCSSLIYLLLILGFISLSVIAKKKQ